MVGLVDSVKWRVKSTALAHMPITGDFPDFTGNRHLEAFNFTSQTQFKEWNAANVVAQWAREDDALVQDSQFTVAGYCAICDQAVNFEVPDAYGLVTPNGRRPNWREQLVCPSCGMFNRMRAALHLAIQDVGVAREDRIYVTEQFGVVYRWLRGHFDHVTGSEYFPTWARGSRRFGITNQDVQALSLPTNSVDSVITFDVLEHVPDHVAALAEFSRVLRPGGGLVMTAPFNIFEHDTLVRAVLRPNGVEHLLPPELHGDPTSPAGGVLSFRCFGWDLLDELTGVGFSEARVHVYHDRRLGYLGGPQCLFSAVNGQGNTE